jgi:hypothetical protein
LIQVGDRAGVSPALRLVGAKLAPRFVGAAETLERWGTNPTDAQKTRGHPVLRANRKGADFEGSPLKAHQVEMRCFSTPEIVKGIVAVPTLRLAVS